MVYIANYIPWSGVGLLMVGEKIVSVDVCCLRQTDGKVQICLSGVHLIKVADGNKRLEPAAPFRHPLCLNRPFHPSPATAVCLYDRKETTMCTFSGY